MTAYRDALDRGEFAPKGQRKTAEAERPPSSPAASGDQPKEVAKTEPPKASSQPAQRRRNPSGNGRRKRQARKRTAAKKT